MKKTCTLCGCSYNVTRDFKAGCVCEDCLQYLKADFEMDSRVRETRQA